MKRPGANLPSPEAKRHNYDQTERKVTVDRRPTGDQIITVGSGFDLNTQPILNLTIPGLHEPNVGVGEHPPPNTLGNMNGPQQVNNPPSNYTAFSQDINAHNPDPNEHHSGTGAGVKNVKGYNKSKKTPKNAPKKPASDLTNKKLKEHIANSASQFKAINQSLQAIQSWMRLGNGTDPTNNGPPTTTPSTNTQAPSTYTPTLFPKPAPGNQLSTSLPINLTTNRNNSTISSCPVSADNSNSINHANLNNTQSSHSSKTNNTIAPSVQPQPSTSSSFTQPLTSSNRQVQTGNNLASFSPWDLSVPKSASTSTPPIQNHLLAGSVQVPPNKSTPAFRPWELPALSGLVVGASNNNHNIPVNNNAIPTNQGIQFQNAGLDNERRIVSGGLPLGWAIDDNIRIKIQQNQFVEFGELLDQSGSNNYSVSVDPESGASFLFVKQKKLVKNIREWDKAFSIYMSIYLQEPSNIQHLPHLISYGNEIKALAEDGLNFIEYDETFRKERAGMRNPWDWNVFRQDLFNRIHRKAFVVKQQTNRKLNFDQSINNNNNVSNFTRVPPGHCYDYHTINKRCNRMNCSYKHDCTCGRGVHPVYLCRSQGNNLRGRGGHSSRGRGGKSTTNDHKQE